MKLKLVFLMVLLVGFASARAQSLQPQGWEAGLGYNYVHSNIRPGCNCFALNGGTASVVKQLTPRIGLEGAFQGVHNGDAGATGKSLNLYTFMIGPRYQWPTSRRIVPFGHVLLGASHATGTLYGSPGTPAEAGYAFATLLGGGVEVPIASRLVLRPVQADYLLTLLPNGFNDRQNNFSLSTGFVFRFDGVSHRQFPRR